MLKKIREGAREISGKSMFHVVGTACARNSEEVAKAERTWEQVTILHSVKERVI